MPIIQNKKTNTNSNSIMTLSPYLHQGEWVFDDEATGLVKEPFVVGIDTMIDVLTAEIPNAKDGFILRFSETNFPTAQIELKWLRPEHGGNWYNCNELKIEGWLCPALYKFYDIAPKNLFIEVKQKTR